MEEAELAREESVKSKRALELELDETMSALSEEKRLRAEVEERCAAATRERNELQTTLEERDLEIDLAGKRLKSIAQMQRLDQNTINELQRELQELHAERDTIRQSVL